MVRQEIDEHQSDEEHRQDDVGQHVAIVIDNVAGHDNGHRPLHVFHERIEQPQVFAVYSHLGGTALAVHHSAGYAVIDQGGREGGYLLECLVQDAVFRGVYEDVAVGVDDEAVRLLFEVLLEALVVLAVYALVALPEPLQRHVGAQHAHRAAGMVVDVDHVCRGELLRGRPVEVGRCPVALAVGEGVLVPCVNQEVGVVLVHLSASYHPRRVAPGIDLEVVASLGIDVRLENQPAARHVGVQAYHPLQVFLQLVGVVDVAFYGVDVVDGSDIDIRQDAANLLVFVANDFLVA